MSDTLATNPYYFLQKRYKRLYFKFTPQAYYWYGIRIRTQRLKRPRVAVVVPAHAPSLRLHCVVFRDSTSLNVGLDLVRSAVQ